MRRPPRLDLTPSKACLHAECVYSSVKRLGKWCGTELAACGFGAPERAISETRLSAHAACTEGGDLYAGIKAQAQTVLFGPRICVCVEHKCACRSLTSMPASSLMQSLGGGAPDAARQTRGEGGSHAGRPGATPV